MSTSWKLKYLLHFALVLFVAGCGGSSGQAGNGTALVSWAPPTQNTDGTALVDLAGYRVYYGSSPNNYDKSITISNPGLSSFLVEGLETADVYFVMTAYNSAGIESQFSQEIYKRISSN